MAITHDVTVELFYSGAWNDHSSTEEVYTGDATHGQDIKITIGGQAESGGITPATASLTFRSWRFNPDNVGGDLYGLIGRNTPIRITVDGDVRFVGEVASWQPGQSLGGDVQVPDRWVEVEAGGELRRIEAGTDPLPSSLRTFYLNTSPEPLAYWPLDPGELSGAALPAFGAGTFDQSTNKVSSLTGADIAPWLESGVGMSKGINVSGRVFMASEEPATWTVDGMFRSTDSSRDWALEMDGNSTNGSDERIDWIIAFEIATGLFQIGGRFVGPSGTTGFVSDSGSFAIGDDQPHHIRFKVTNNGADVDWDVWIDGDLFSSGTQTSQDMQGLSTVRIYSPDGTGSEPARFSHIAVWDEAPPSIADTYAAASGHAGETAGDRFVRICGESGVTDTLVGTADDTVPMGPQFRGTLAAQYEDIRDTDGGLIFDTVDGAGVSYKTGPDLYNQAAALTLDYAAYEVAPPLRPVLDDKLIRNDITAERPFGSTARAVDETSVAAVGRYTSKPDTNVFSDLILPAAAGWALHVGTTSGTRFAQVTVDLDASPALVDAVVAVRVGDRIDLTNLPAELTPNAASLIVNGWAELAAADRRKITFNCFPEAPFHVPEVEHDDYAVIDADDGKTTVRTAFNTETGTVLNVQNNYGTFLGYWSSSAMPYDIVVAGVRLTVTAAFSDGDPNFHFDVVKGPVNGVLKTIPVGAEVHVFSASHIGL